MSSGTHAPSTWRRTAREFQDDNITAWAAALTYYGVLSIFPALLALVSIVGLMGTSATSALRAVPRAPRHPEDERTLGQLLFVAVEPHPRHAKDSRIVRG